MHVAVFAEIKCYEGIHRKTYEMKIYDGTWTLRKSEILGAVKDVRFSWKDKITHSLQISVKFVLVAFKESTLFTWLK